MDREKVLELIAAGSGEEEPIIVPHSALQFLWGKDIPAGARIQVGQLKDGILHIDLDAELFSENGSVVADYRSINTRKYWYLPLNLEHYSDLMMRAAEVRAKEIGDVYEIELEDDGAYVLISFKIITKEQNLLKGFSRVLQVVRELEEIAERTTASVATLASDARSRLSGWGSSSLDELVVAVETANSLDQKGRSLEELVSRLFETIPGMSVTDRVRTETEEIDLSILNDSADPRFRKEGPLILAECKNWSGKCGKNDFVTFLSKIGNRSGRTSVGFLVSWNGFTETVSKKMLRGTRERELVVPMEGKDIRRAVTDGNFFQVLAECWTKAVNL
jgi:hypothetical protein